MKIEFGKEYLLELYRDGKATDKRHRYQKGIVRNYIRRVELLNTVVRLEDLFPFTSLNVESLAGKKRGLYSIRINIQYRLEFELDEDKGICRITEISNHYE